MSLFCTLIIYFIPIVLGRKCAQETCKLPRRGGECCGYVPSFYYNSKIELCEKFIYTGCGGNDNRFETLKLCIDECENHECKYQNDDSGGFDFDKIFAAWDSSSFSSSSSSEEKRKKKKKVVVKTNKSSCNQPSDEGSCSNLQQKYFYNTKTKKCQEFIYGGCGGNSNRYDTFEECQYSCSGQQDGGQEDSGKKEPARYRNLPYF